MFELARQFRFEAAHTLPGRAVDAEPSRRIHGHSYRAEVTLRGTPDPASGMVMDLGLLERALDVARDGLDHRFLDEVAGLGPATMENLALWIWRTVAPSCPGLFQVSCTATATGSDAPTSGRGSRRGRIREGRKAGLCPNPPKA